MYGPPGSGKTSLALHAASQLGDRVMYVGFYETADKLVAKVKSLGLDPGRFVIFDFLSVSDVDVLLSSVTSQYFKVSPDVVIIDGINALPQSRESAAALYRIFHTNVIAIGEEQIGGSHFAYVADTLLEVSQVFHRGARYRRVRVVKTRLGPPPGAEYYFTISRRGVLLVKSWSQGLLGDEPVAAPSGRRAAFSEGVVKALTSMTPRYRRPGLLAGSRVGVFLEEHPVPLRLSAAYLCDYLDNVKVGVLSTYPLMSHLAKSAGCEVEEVVVPAAGLGDDVALHDALDKVGEAPVVSLYGLEEVWARYGVERVSYIMDLIQSVSPRTAILATFRGVEPAAEALNLFNTVWYYARDRAVVVKSALGWPVRELKIVEEGGRFVLKEF
ncbi:MAG: ATPase domain-containing protein [Pyrobaculum sp.]